MRSLCDECHSVTGGVNSLHLWSGPCVDVTPYWMGEVGYDFQAPTNLESGCSCDCAQMAQDLYDVCDVGDCTNTEKVYGGCSETCDDELYDGDDSAWWPDKMRPCMTSEEDGPMELQPDVQEICYDPGAGVPEPPQPPMEYNCWMYPAKKSNWKKAKKECVQNDAQLCSVDELGAFNNLEEACYPGQWLWSRDKGQKPSGRCGKKKYKQVKISKKGKLTTRCLKQNKKARFYCCSTD